MIRQTGLRAAAAALLLPLALAACAGDAEPADTPVAAATSAAPVPSSLPTTPVPVLSATPSQAADEESAQVVTLTVVGGEVTGDTGRVPVEQGSRVRLTVTADVVDEIHLHGYDLHQDTIAGQPATLEFTADQPGVFEVELEESRVLLTRLQVQ